MNRAEFCSLPLSIALGIVWNVLHKSGNSVGALLDGYEPPKPARPPKYDSAIYRKDGITWASEYDAEGLRFWQKRKAESGSSGSEWAEKDAKAAKALGFFLEWREQNPTAIWSGERNREQVTARAPSGKPEVYARDAGRRAPEPKPSSGGGFDAADGYDDDPGDLPF